MAGYSKGIVDTRKLNKNSKARLGRKGDTKIRKVDNRESHVNALEAYLIDVNGKAGEEYAKRVGAGTVNPLTGMPEYHEANDHSTADHKAHGTTTTTDDEGNPITTTNYNQPLYTTAEVTSNVSLLESGYEKQAEDIVGEQSYESLTDMSDIQRQGMLLKDFGIGQDYMKYISPFETKPFDFIRQGADIERSQLGQDRSKLGYDISGAAGDILDESRGQVSGAGFEGSGGITSQLNKQMKGLTQSYNMGMKSIGLQDTAIGLQEDQNIYAEQRKQREGFYTDVAAAVAAKG